MYKDTSDMNIMRQKREDCLEKKYKISHKTGET